MKPRKLEMLVCCMNCNRIKIRGEWSSMKLVDADVPSPGSGPKKSHGVCPACRPIVFPDIPVAKVWPDPDSIEERNTRAMAYLAGKRR